MNVSGDNKPIKDQNKKFRVLEEDAPGPCRHSFKIGAAGMLGRDNIVCMSTESVAPEVCLCMPIAKERHNLAAAATHDHVHIDILCRDKGEAL